MARSYDNWERLVTATLRREHLRIIGQRTPSELSLASLSSFSSFNLDSSSSRISSFNFSSLLVGNSLSYHQIIQATDYLNEFNLIKHGRSGDLFYGVLEGGVQVVVKKIDLSSVNKESLFISELETLGKVSHHRFVPLLGHCLENANEKFLVYKYMSNKDLSSSLSRKTVPGSGRQSPFLDWTTRLKIATEVAEILSYLHHQCVPPHVHRDIQASSILLDDKFEVRLGSLYKVCAEERSIALTVARASEQDNIFGTDNASCATSAYDVYSFGKVLVELITGKPGFSASDDSTMKEWMENALAYIVTDNEELLMNMVDSTLIKDKHLLSQVWAVAFIAKACLSSESYKRPQMAKIFVALEHIKSAWFTNGKLKPIGHYGSVSTALVIAKILQGSEIVGSTPQATGNRTTSGRRTALRNHGMLEASGIEEANIRNGGIFIHPNLTTFSYDELMAAIRGFVSDTVLGEGEFGANQAWLIDKSTSKSGSRSPVAVRKLYSQNKQLLEDWQSQASFLGTLSHPNLVMFLGYCLEDKELFVVHEFMQSGNLEKHLFRTSSDVQPLSWYTRIKILIGAARGLAFLHAAKWQGFYEYFGTSDILLGSSYIAKISGIGTAKTARPNVFDEVHPNFYKNRYANGPPEHSLAKDIPIGLLNVKGDVYGFGVVLAEMLTGLSAKGRYRLRQGESHLVPFFRSHTSLDRNQLQKIMDPQLEGKYSLKAAQKMGSLAWLCLQDEPEFRPSMKQVVEVLERIESAEEEVKEPRIKQTAYDHGPQPR